MLVLGVRLLANSLHIYTAVPINVLPVTIPSADEAARARSMRKVVS